MSVPELVQKSLPTVPQSSHHTLTGGCEKQVVASKEHRTGCMLTIRSWLAYY